MLTVLRHMSGSLVTPAGSAGALKQLATSDVRIITTATLSGALALIALDLLKVFYVGASVIDVNRPALAWLPTVPEVVTGAVLTVALFLGATLLIHAIDTRTDLGFFDNTRELAVFIAGLFAIVIAAKAIATFVTLYGMPACLTGKHALKFSDGTAQCFARQNFTDLIVGTCFLIPMLARCAKRVLVLPSWTLAIFGAAVLWAMKSAIQLAAVTMFPALKQVF